MFGVHDISVDFLSDLPALVLLAAVATLALTYWLYRRPVPPVPWLVKVPLGSLRVLALLCLFAALFEPVISYQRDDQRTRRLALLIDRSSSMERLENGISRRVRVDSLLSSDTYAELARQVEVSRYYFGGNLATSLQDVEAEKTALGHALYELERLQVTERIDYCLLLSDGRSNSGRDPVAAAAAVSMPVLAVNVSGEQGLYDVGLADIAYNPVVFVGEQTNVRAKLSVTDAVNRRIEVQLLDSNRVLAQQTVTVTQEQGLAEVDLQFAPTEPGQRILKIQVPASEDEARTENNSRSFAVKVLKSKLAVLLVTSGPDYEIGFLRRRLERSDKYEVTLIVTGSHAGNLAGMFPSGQTELNRYDLIILYDPDPHALTTRRSLVQSYLADRGGALWFIMGPRFAAAGPESWLSQLLPFSQSSQRAVSYVEFRAIPKEEHLFHPALRLADNQSSIREAWSELPPFQLLVECDVISGEGTILAESSRPIGAAQNAPVLGYRRIGPGKVIASAALPFWTWGFASLGFGGDDAAYRAFIDGAVSWLTVRDDIDPVRVLPEKGVFSRGEVVRFDGFAFDLGFRPIRDVTGQVRLIPTSGGETLTADMIPVSEGQYAAEFQNLVPDQYRWSARFEKEDRLLKETSGTILIEPFSLEDFHHAGDPALMAAVARQSAGNYVSYSEFDLLPPLIDLKPLVISEHADVVIWNRKILLVLFILALSIEWLVRKAYQLM